MCLQIAGFCLAFINSCVNPWPSTSSANSSAATTTATSSAAAPPAASAAPGGPGQPWGARGGPGGRGRGVRSDVLDEGSGGGGSTVEEGQHADDDHDLPDRLLGG